jgi:hypothetical protein
VVADDIGWVVVDEVVIDEVIAGEVVVGCPNEAAETVLASL